MKGIIKRHILCIGAAMTMTACMENGLKEELGTLSSNAVIVFSAEGDSSWNTPAPITPSRATKQPATRVFLGLLEKDSLFITLREEENSHLSFPAHNPTNQTRGAYKTEEFDKFYVTAFLDNGDKWLDNSTAIHPSGETYWECSPTACWPRAELSQQLDFFAHAWNVWNGEGVPVNPQYSIAKGSGDQSIYQGTFEYSLPVGQTVSPINDAANQPDLIFAITPEQDRETDPIVLTFYHALSAVIFKWQLPEDVTDADATLALSGVVSGGSCELAFPLLEEETNEKNFQWTPSTETGTYTIEGFQGQGSEEENFMMIPQTLDEGAMMKLSIKVGAKTYRYEKALKEFKINDDGETIAEWKPNKRYTYTFSISEYVEVDIDEEVTSTVKSNVRLQNTGLTTAYLRAAVVGYWENKDGDIIGSWNIDDTTIGQLTKATNWSTHWEKGTDGFYYHKTAVLPGEYTNVALFDKYELNSSGAPEEGAKLIINIVAQAIDTDLLATSGWPLPSTTTTNE